MASIYHSSSLFSPPQGTQASPLLPPHSPLPTPAKFSSKTASLLSSPAAVKTAGVTTGVLASPTKPKSSAAPSGSAKYVKALSFATLPQKPKSVPTVLTAKARNPYDLLTSIQSLASNEATLNIMAQRPIMTPGPIGKSSATAAATSSRPLKRLRLDPQLAVTATDSSSDLLAMIPDPSGFLPTVQRPTTPEPMGNSSAAAAAAASVLMPEAFAFSLEAPATTIKPSRRQPEPEQEARDRRRNRKVFLRAMADPNLSNAMQNVAKMQGLLEQSDFVVNGTTYKKGGLLGTGQFAQTHASDNPGFVLKLAHENAIFFDLFQKPTSYWEGVKRNYDCAVKLRLSNDQTPVAQILNSDTLVTDLFAIQEKVTPLDNLTSEQLNKHLPQIKDLFALFYKEKLVLELHKKNLGFSEARSTLVVYDLDREAELNGSSSSDDDLPKDEAQTISLIHNLERNLRSFGSAAASLDPR